MSYIWKIPNIKNDYPYCLNLTQKEEELVILGYVLAKHHGKDGIYWMTHIEQHFFNNANAISMVDLCYLNIWLEENGYHDICYVPYTTVNPSTGPNDRSIFSERRDTYLGVVNNLDTEIVEKLANEIASEIRSCPGEIEADSLQQEGIDAYYLCMDALSEQESFVLERGPMRAEELIKEMDEDNMPSLVRQDDFIIGKDVDLEEEYEEEEEELSPKIKKDIDSEEDEDNNVEAIIKFLTSIRDNFDKEQVNSYIKTLENLKGDAFL